MASVYILYSPSLDSFYTGATTEAVILRLERHLHGYYDNKYTAKAKDWELYFEISCSSMEEAMKIEHHIKRMKSKKYIQDLKRYPEMVNKLKEKYSNS
jgi:putative endonuclease